MLVTDGFELRTGRTLRNLVAVQEIRKFPYDPAVNDVANNRPQLPSHRRFCVGVVHALILCFELIESIVNRVIYRIFEDSLILSLRLTQRITAEAVYPPANLRPQEPFGSLLQPPKYLSAPFDNNLPHQLRCDYA